MAKTAFITGANGIGGSAIDSIIVTSGGPFNPTVTDPRIKFIALDFTHDTPSLVEKMKEVCGPVSHAYFCSYLHKDDFAESYAANKTLFENFLRALDKTAPSWRTLRSSLAESTTTSRSNPCRLRRGKTTHSAMDHSKTSIFPKKTDWPRCSVERPGRGMSSGPRPSTRYWEGIEDVSYATLIVDLTIFVSTRKSCANEASNGEFQLDWSLAEWCQDKRKVWEDLCDRQGSPGAKVAFDLAGWTVGDFLFQRTWSATLSVNKVRRFGWTCHIDSYQSFVDTFDKFRSSG
ncbi:uncharacterized protein BDW43DRAFT_302957 [Aspergillus alliaceus]|uniref:uncharacterized protein n=1 Tax=Petromyces alliaceus TaxID=209559 RepID=UPI0012A4E1DF|nr:uncharacterized protein BDW43DRAFT_302957 [Aspergillus alliaceus]KAB8229678.1 hypothetical protein BDW43DRAFT_302957 [Aspergillus alliaceus]